MLSHFVAETTALVYLQLCALEPTGLDPPLAGLPSVDSNLSGRFGPSGQQMGAQTQTHKLADQGLVNVETYLFTATPMRRSLYWQKATAGPLLMIDNCKSCEQQPWDQRAAPFL